MKFKTCSNLVYLHYRVSLKLTLSHVSFIMILIYD